MKDIQSINNLIKVIKVIYMKLKIKTTLITLTDSVLLWRCPMILKTLLQKYKFWKSYNLIQSRLIPMFWRTLLKFKIMAPWSSKIKKKKIRNLKIKSIKYMAISYFKNTICQFKTCSKKIKMLLLQSSFSK